MSFEVIGTNRANVPFSPAIRSGDFVFVSGQASVDETGAIVADTFDGEMRRAIGNLRSILANGGLDLGDVVQVRAYVHDAGDMTTYNALYREYFSEPLPARTTLVGCLGGVVKFEIDAVAYGPSPGGTSS